MNSKVISSILLIAGCSIGAGMLGVPVLSEAFGFIPSSLVLIASWLYLLATAFALSEACTMCHLHGNLNLVSKQLLGNAGKWIVTCLFLYLFTCILVAYSVATPDILKTLHIPPFTYFPVLIIVAISFYFGIATSDLLNKALMFALFASFFLLIFTSFPFIQSKNLTWMKFEQITLLFPVAVLAYGFHNLVAPLTHYLEGSKRHIYISFTVGSAIPLVIYLIWNAVILGLVTKGEASFDTLMQEGKSVPLFLETTTKNPYVKMTADLFSLFAILTSLIGVGYSFYLFLRDLLHIKEDSKKRLLLSFLALLIPYLVSFIYPHIFLKALDLAGLYGTLTLFGILPPLMVWRGRYHLHLPSTRFLPGGKLALLILIVIPILLMIDRLS